MSVKSVIPADNSVAFFPLRSVGLASAIKAARIENLRMQMLSMDIGRKIQALSAGLQSADQQADKSRNEGL